MTKRPSSTQSDGYMRPQKHSKKSMLFVFLLLMTSPADAFAQSVACGIDFSDGGTHIIDFPCEFDGELIVSNFTDVRVLTGGILSSDGFSSPLAIESRSTLEVTGGAVESVLFLTENSMLEVNSGHVGDVFISDSARVRVFGGEVPDGIHVSGNSTDILIAGGTVGGIGGETAGGDILISGGVVTSFGGEILRDFIVVGGVVEQGFTIGGFGDGAIRGGTIRGAAGASSDVDVRVFGDNFKVDGVPVGDGVLDTCCGVSTLTGDLQLGGDIEMEFFGSGISDNIFELVTVPEGSFVATIATGIPAIAAFMVVRRRRRM